jgi:lipoprotein LprG
MPLRGSAVALLTAGLLSTAVAGCSGDSNEAPERSPAEQLAAAAARLEKSRSVTFTLESEGFPPRAVGVTAAKGTGRFAPPSFKGTLNATVGGVTGAVDVIAVEQDVFMKFFTPGYNKIDPATYGAPNPAQIFNPETGVTSLIDQTTAPTEKGRVRDGADVLTSISGTVPGDAVADLFVVGQRSSTFEITYGITESGDELRKVVLVGPFYAGTTSTYTLRLEELESAVEITRP